MGGVAVIALVTMLVRLLVRRKRNKASKLQDSAEQSIGQYGKEHHAEA